MKLVTWIVRVGTCIAASILLSGTSATGQSSPPPRQDPPSAVPEDVNVSGAVDVLDIERFAEMFGVNDPAADINDDGVLDVRDIIAMEVAVADQRRERLLVPDIEGYEPRDLVRVRGVMLLVYKQVATGSLGYLAVPFDGRASLDGPDTVQIITPTGATAMATFSASFLTTLTYDEGSGARLVAEIQVQYPEFESNIESLLLADPLPPIGTCPTCVPLRVPAPGCVYLFSKWGYSKNCLSDFYGCTDSNGNGSQQHSVACCKETSPGSNVPTCPGSGSTSTP